MRTKKSRLIVLFLLSTLYSCTNINSEASSTSFFYDTTSSYSEESSDDSSSSIISSDISYVDPTSESSSASSSSETPAKKTITGFLIDDSINYYIVGESFADIQRMSVILYFSDNTSLDVSGKLNYYNIHLRNNEGVIQDHLQPFTKIGFYQLYVSYIRDPEIRSNVLPIEVKNYIFTQLEEKTDATPLFNYADLESSLLQNLSFPSSGLVNGLVIPIEIKDFPFVDAGYGEAYIDAIDRVFNGEGETDTLYWESVGSYYRKASQGTLDLVFDVAEPFLSNKTSGDLLNMNASSADYLTSLDMATLALDNYKKNHGGEALKKYDNDEDGLIDGLWFVYSAPDYASYNYNHNNAGLFWAFCTDSIRSTPNLHSPDLHSYSWASLSFIINEPNDPSVDGHTYIHETGHLLGLPDYYSYDRSYGSQGGLAMMDLNIGDQDAFSKIALGWSNPYVVTEDCRVTIKPNVINGDSILIADQWNGTAFDEYILIDLQVPVGLNVLDASTSYDYRPLYYSEPGIRMLHVDARIGQFKYLYVGEDDAPYTGIYAMSDETQSSMYLEDDQVQALIAKQTLPRMSLDASVSFKNRDAGYSVINANSASRTLIQEKPYVDNRLLSLITANQVSPEDDSVYASNQSLFQKGDNWSMKNNGFKFFAQVPDHFNNGDEFNWIITVVECDDQSATIQFRKIVQQS